MPTLVKFNSGEKLMLSEDYDKVNQQLGTQTAGLFTRGDGTRVTVFAANIDYLQDSEGGNVPLVDVG